MNGSTMHGMTMTSMILSFLVIVAMLGVYYVATCSNVASYAFV